MLQGQSWRNPVERMMSIVNLGLQSQGLMRNAEKALKNCNALKQIRSAGEKCNKEIETAHRPQTSCAGWS